jgi:hypothetical protein
LGIFRFFEYAVSEINSIFTLNKGKCVGKMPEKKRSDKEFQEYLHSFFANDPLKVKYQQPDAWRKRPAATKE